MENRVYSPEREQAEALAATVRDELMRFSDDSYRVDIGTLAVVPGSHGPRPRSHVKPALEALDALAAAVSRLEAERDAQEQYGRDAYEWMAHEKNVVESLLAQRERELAAAREALAGGGRTPTGQDSGSARLSPESEPDGVLLDRLPRTADNKDSRKSGGGAADVAEAGE